MEIKHNCKLMNYTTGTIVQGKNMDGEFDLYKITKVDRENEVYEIEDVNGNTHWGHDSGLTRASWYFQRFGLKSEISLDNGQGKMV